MDASESTAVDVAFYLQNPLDERAVRCYHADAPARHIVAFAHRIEFDAVLFGVFYLHDTQRFGVQNQAVWIVVDDDDVVPPPEIDQFLV